MPKISSYPDNGVKNADQYVVAIGGVNKKRLGILPHLYKIVPSVASNNLTLALQDLDGNVFSATNPLQTKLSDELVVIESALSVTKNAATNWANLGSDGLKTLEQDLFTYLIKETGASAGIKLGWSRIPYGTVVGDFSSTTTNEKYLAGPTNYNATDKVQNIGRFNATLSAGAGYTWSIPATSVIINTTIYKTRWLDFTIGYTGFSSNPTTTKSSYQLNGTNVKIYYVQNALGTSNANTFTLTQFPFNFLLTQVLYPVLAWGADNSANLTSPLRVDVATNIVTLGKDINNTTTWTASGTKGCYGLFFEYLMD